MVELLQKVVLVVLRRILLMVVVSQRICCHSLTRSFHDDKELSDAETHAYAYDPHRVY